MEGVAKGPEPTGYFVNYVNGVMGFNEATTIFTELVIHRGVFRLVVYYGFSTSNNIPNQTVYCDTPSTQKKSSLNVA